METTIFQKKLPSSEVRFADGRSGRPKGNNLYSIGRKYLKHKRFLAENSRFKQQATANAEEPAD
jgi:hypothetical protein